MKRVLIIGIMLLGFVGQSWGQEVKKDISANSAYDLLRFHKDSLVNEYNCIKPKRVQAVQPKLLDKNLYGIYQAIIPSAQNLSNNASAFTYAYNEDKQTLGISAAFPFRNKKKFLNVGINTEASDGLFNLYSSGSWNNNVAFNLGYSGVLFASQYLNSVEKCEKCKNKREIYADSLVLAYAKSLAIDTAELTKEKKIIKDKIDALINLKDVKEIAADTTDYIKQLKEINKKLEYYEELKQIVKDREGKEYLADKLAEFDEKKNLLDGYNILWWNINGGIANTTINIADSLYAKSVRTQHHPTIQLIASLMFNRSDKRALQYISLSVSAKRGNFLNDPTFRGAKPNIIYQDNIPFVSMNDNIVGAFDDITKAVWQHTFSLYYANFCLFSKSLGFSFRFEYNNAFKNKIYPNYKANYTLAIGPIFRSAKEDNFSKATFGILAGFINTPFKGKANDFSVQAYMGIPFNALISKK